MGLGQVADTTRYGRVAEGTAETGVDRQSAACHCGERRLTAISGRAVRRSPFDAVFRTPLVRTH